MMSMTKLLGFLLIVIVGFIFILTYINFFTVNDNVVAVGGENEQPTIVSFTIEKPYLVVRGKNLDSVEIFAKTAIGETSSSVLLGTSELDPVISSDFDRWLFMIPSQPILIEEILARGYSKGEVSSEMTLNVYGEVGLYNALWATGQSMLFPLKVGQTGTFENLSFKFNQIIQDSRCPLDVTCVWAGDFQVAATVTVDGLEENLEIVDSQEAHRFNNYLIDIVKIEPAVLTTTESNNYVVTFSIIKQPKI